MGPFHVPPPGIEACRAKGNRMRTSLAPEEIPSLLAPMVCGCPGCKHLMFYKGVEPWTLMYGHQLERYTFDCGYCGNSITHIVDDDQE